MTSPPDWQHLDHGREQRFERGTHQISLADLGPATRDAFQREIARARELFRLGQVADSRTILEGLQIRRMFPSALRWQAFQPSWKIILRAGRERRPVGPEAIDRAYTEVLVEVGALPRPDMTTLAQVALAQTGHDERRDVVLEQAMAIGGRGALLLDTWDRLNHQQRKRHVFVLNEGNLLVARMELGRFVEMEAAFDSLVASLQFARPPAAVS